jgi:hypothetical protein
MQKALYFPHTEIDNPVIIKNALLLWDSVETIVPSGQWIATRKPTDKLLREATELIVNHRVPTDAERREAHLILEEQVTTGVLASLVKNSPRHWGGADYLVYPEKFLNQTWHLLEHRGMARWVSAEYDYGVPAAVGYFMMSILADVCAGTQIQKITDRTEAYAWIAEQHARTLGAQYIKGLDVSQIAPNHDRLVALSIEALDARAIPLKKLVEMRKRELRGPGTGYSAMRRRYLSALDAHLSRIGSEARSESDVKELDRQFKEDLKQDLADLKAELGLASTKALFSKEVALSTLILAGSLVAPIAGLTALATEIGAVGIIPLLGAAVKLRAERRKALRKHTMSWLFLGTQRRISLR